MTDQWTEGEPSEDGYYACIVKSPSCPGGMMDRLVRRVNGKNHETWGGVNDPASNGVLVTIVRHIRLPEPQKPLELPRRFRGILNGKSVVGVEAESGKVIVTSGCCGGCQIYWPSDLAQLHWEDQ